MECQPTIQEFQKRIDIVVGQLTTLHLHRKVFRRYAEVVQKNEELALSGALFHNWVLDNYVTFVTMSIRRQTDTRGSDTYSLAKLLKLMASDTSLLTREWNRALYVNLSPLIADSIATGAYDQVAGAGKSITVQTFENDLNSLKKAALQVKEFADNRIAHDLHDKSVGLKTMSEVDVCIDFITDMARRYQVLLTAVSSTIDPQIIGDWDRVFLVPWVAESLARSAD